MRIGVLAVVLALEAPAFADPPGWLETSGFAGVNALPGNIALGASSDPEQRPQTAPELGARLTWIALPLSHFELGVEAEAAITTSWTGYGFGSEQTMARASDFAPVLAYRGSLVLRLAESRQIAPHVLVGAGGASVVTHSPFLRDTTDPELFYGVGATIELTPGVQLRVDGRQGFIATEGGGRGATYELLAGIGTAFGRPSPPPPPVESPPPPLEAPAAAEPAPPPPPIASVAPPPPPVSIAPADPTADRDGDGIPDAADKCPDDPETVNGFEDDDGCPDAVPAEITAALATADTARFEPGRARLSEPAKAAFEPAIDLMRTHPTLHVNVVAHAGANDAAGELATKRADVVKWHFVDEGVPEDQLTVVLGAALTDEGPTDDRAPIELVLVRRAP